MILHSHSIGDGPILVILHGLFGSWENWGTQMRALSKHYRVIGLDLRNHGASRHVQGMSYTAMAEDVVETLEALDIKHYALLGHSMGGKVAMTLALSRQPYQSCAPNRLIIVDIAPRSYPPQHWDILHAMHAIDTSALRSRAEAEQQLMQAIPEPAIRQFILKNLQRLKTGGYRWQLNLDALRNGYDQLLEMPTIEAADRGRYEQPVLVIRGALSDYVGAADLSLFERHFMHYQLVTIDGAGHWPHASHVGEVQNTLLEFLSQPK